MSSSLPPRRFLVPGAGSAAVAVALAGMRLQTGAPGGEPRTSSRMPWVVRLPLPVAALREGLLPRGDVEVDPRRFADWLTEA